MEYQILPTGRTLRPLWNLQVATLWSTSRIIRSYSVRRVLFFQVMESANVEEDITFCGA